MKLRRFSESESNKLERLKRYTNKKCISKLETIINDYMENTIDGDLFEDEQDFEENVREMLKAKGFIVQEKQNVGNAIQEVNERSFSGEVEDKIPDIVVECREGLVFLELKLNDSNPLYFDDRMKVQEYRNKIKYVAAGVLFLDKKQHPSWVQCRANSNYNYYWDLR